MHQLVQRIKESTSYQAFDPADAQQIEEAQAALQLIFAPDYLACLQSFGAVTVHDRELTGICPSRRLHVVTATEHARQIYPAFPKDAYVIEDLGIDRVYAVQKADGAVYYYGPADNAQPTADSLTAYLFPEET